MRELLISLPEQGAKYKHIYHSIRLLIEEGNLKNNAKLPSIRHLAQILNVSRNTTLLAYEQLLAEGYIRSEQKKGYFVEDFEPVDIEPSLHTEQITELEKNHSSIKFHAGTVDHQSFPLKDWRHCANEVLKEDIIYTYGNCQGDQHLRENITTYLLQSRGIRTSAGSIVIGSSTQQLLLYLSLLIKGEHSSIAVENPGYDGARTIFQLQGFQIYPIDVTERGLSIEQLERTNTNLVYLTPSHQFPTGVTLPVTERQHMLRWALERNGYIIEDDYDSEFRYKQQPIPALASLQQNGRVIYVSTFSKAFLPSIRLSYMVLPSELLARYKQQFVAVEQTASIIHQRTMALFMERGHWDSHIRRMRATYKRKMQILVAALQEAFGETIQIIGSQSGLYLLIRIKLEVSEGALIRQALNYGVKVYPTARFFINKQISEPILQMGFSGLSTEQIRKGVQLLKKAWNPE